MSIKNANAPNVTAASNKKNFPVLHRFHGEEIKKIKRCEIVGN
jgi:hypothetical protein